MAAVIELADTVDEPRFQPDQVALVVGCSRAHAMSELAWGRNLVAYLPAVWAAWRAGEIDRYRAWIFADVLVTLFDDDPGVAAALAARVLPSAGEMPCGRLRQKLRRLLIKADAHAVARRTAMTVEDRHVYLSAESHSATACLGATHLPAERAAAAFERVDAIARARRNGGDARTLEQLRADTLCDLLEGVDVGARPVARPGVVELTVPLATAAGLGHEPGDLAGFGPVVADIARQIALARRDHQWRYSVTNDGELVYHGITTARPVPHDSAAAAGDSPSAANPADTVSRDTGPAAHAPRDTGTPTAHRPCPPTQADPRRRLPGPKLRRWIAARDRTCQGPGCHAPARVCDVDHVIDHARGGPTEHTNLMLLCRRHHRAKHLGFLTPMVTRPGHTVWVTKTGETYWNDE
jgi:hypothetical protein